MNAVVRSFFKLINFKKLRSETEESKYVYNNINPIIANKLRSYMDQMYDGHDEVREEFYKLKNSSLNVSLAITCVIYYNYFEKVLEYLYENIDELDGNILVVGCDCGIEACFLKKINPSLSITGIDINSDAINNAVELAKKLDLDVKFEAKALADVVGEYDAVISIRTAHENVNLDNENQYLFKELTTKKEYYKQCFAEYAKQLTSVLVDYGVILSLERFYEITNLAWMENIEDNGVGILALDNISDGKESYLIVLGQKCEQDSSAIEIWQGYYLKNFNKTASSYEGIEAEFFLSQAAGNFIKGYYILDKGKFIYTILVCQHKKSGRSHQSGTAGTFFGALGQMHL